MTKLAEWTIQVTHLYRKWLHLFINESVYLNKLAEWMIQMTHLIHLWLNLCVWKNRLNRRLGDSLFFFSFSITVTHSFLMDWLNEIVFLNINVEWFKWLCFPSIIVFVSLTCLCCCGFLKCYVKPYGYAYCQSLLYWMLLFFCSCLSCVLKLVSFSNHLCFLSLVDTLLSSGHGEYLRNMFPDTALHDSECARSQMWLLFFNVGP